MKRRRKYRAGDVVIVSPVTTGSNRASCSPSFAGKTGEVVWIHSPMVGVVFSSRRGLLPWYFYPRELIDVATL